MSGIRNVVIDGRRTSMRLEPEIWATLEDAAALEGVSVDRICSLVKERRHTSNLSSAVRVFTLLYRTVHRLSVALDQLGPAVEPVAPLVPLELASAVPTETRHAGTGSSCLEGLAYALESLPAFPHPIFREVLGCWHALRPGNGPGVPSHEALRPHLERIGAVAIPRDPAAQSMAVTIIDVSAENPRGFLLGETQAVTSLFAGRDVSHRPVADHPFLLHARAMLQDFSIVKNEQVPAFHVLRHTFGGRRRHYARLAVPLSNGGRYIDAVMTVATRLSPPTFLRRSIAVPA